MGGSLVGRQIRVLQLKTNFLVAPSGTGDECCPEPGLEAADGRQQLVVGAVVGRLPWPWLGVRGHAEVAVASEASCGTLWLP